VTPAWRAVAAPAEPLQALWLGHVTFLVQAHGWHFVTDPVFSKYAAPVQFAGPARFTPPPAAVADLPPVHFVLISHNHYDHLDSGSVASLLRKEAGDLARIKAGGPAPLHAWQHQPFTGTTWCCPLGVKRLLVSMGVAPERVVEMDWWDIHTHPQPHPVHGSEAPTPGPSIIAVPAQHQSARTPWDRNKSLWCGYAVVAPPPHSTLAARLPTAAGPASGGAGAPTSTSLSPAAAVSDAELRFYFSGDTGYRTVPDKAGPYSDGERAAPVCPAFKQIGERYGPFDLALLPIGAYSPRTFMSAFHASPEDAVEMHTDLRSKRSIGMHWGTFALTDEPIEEPPARLAEAVSRKGLSADSFVAVQHGHLVGASGRVQ
jgi:N-acyl-phosphatidylethanolamine-hydrolysing phospholipase D